MDRRGRRFGAVSPGGARAPKRTAPWRRTKFERNVADFQRILKRNRLWVHLGAAGFVVLLLAGGLLAGLPGALLNGADQAKSSLGSLVGLKFETLTLEGESRVAREDVAAVLGFETGTALLDIDVAATRARIEALDWVKEATVLRMPPNRVHVRVVEHQPVFLWQLRGEFSVVDAVGNEIAAVDYKDFRRLLHVVGPGAGAAAPKLKAWLDVLPEIRDHVRSAVWRGHRRWDLHLSNTLVVELPDRELDKAFAVLTRMIVAEDLLTRDADVLDLRNPDAPRMRLSPEAAHAMWAPGEET